MFEHVQLTRCVINYITGMDRSCSISAYAYGLANDFSFWNTYSTMSFQYSKFLFRKIKLHDTL